MIPQLASLLLLTTAAAAPAPAVATPTPSAAPWQLLAETPVDGSGIHLHQLLAPASVPVQPALLLAPAPAPGQIITLTRQELVGLIVRLRPSLLPIYWTGSDQILVSRRTRTLAEPELLNLAIAALEERGLAEAGQLELLFSRPWTSILIPDDPLTLRISDLPPNGLHSTFILRFDLFAGPDRVGNWQLPVDARLWGDILVARAPLKRGTFLAEAPLVTERRDILTVREPLDPGAAEDPSLEVTEPISPGMPVLRRSVRVRPAVRRGTLVDAIIHDGPLLISLKVQVLEDALPGQSVRVRNTKSKREFNGIVQNENTILVQL